MTSFDNQQKLKAELLRLQHEPNDRLLLFKPLPCGLGGQIAGRVQTMAFALGLKRKAIFLSNDDPPYGQTFDPLFSGDISGIDPESAELVHPHLEQAAPLLCYDPRKMEIRTPEYERPMLARIEAAYGVPMESRLMLEGIIFNTMPVCAPMRAYCEAEKARLGINQDTLGVHFRRGDKAVETAFVPASAFNRAIARMYEMWEFSSLFLASDSPLAPREIKLPKGVRLIFDADEPRYNNANHKMLVQSPGLVEQETRSAFKNIYLLAQCGGVIGQNNAHFATLAAASILARDNSSVHSVLIDGWMAEKGSRRLAAFFAAKKKVRAVGRFLFPWLTMSARMKRVQKSNGGEIRGRS